MSERLPQNEPSNFDENENLDRKSLRVVLGKTADWNELAKDCVCFANARGGTLVIGIENDSLAPPPDQRIEHELLSAIEKRVRERSVNVQVRVEKEVHENGGEYLRLHIARSPSAASTSDGRYYMRVGDDCQPIVGDDVMRLADERSGTPWEASVSLRLDVSSLNSALVNKLCQRLRSSDRVKPSVKEKSEGELLEHYGLSKDGVLTNLGVLVLGSPHQRRMLGSAPLIQAIKYDDRHEKVAKWVWDDNELAPHEVIDAVWQEVADFRESYEIPDGMFRTKVPAFDEVVVREVLVNALVHRPYTQRGDIFLNLHPDHMEIVNPGRLPLGVTPKNILHQSRRRNEGFARLFHDLGLMEREGSGIDLIYEKLLLAGKNTPKIVEQADSVHVTIPRRVLHPSVLRLIATLEERYQLSQRERIAVGLLAQSEGMRAVDLVERLELHDPSEARPWLDRLLSLGVLGQTGRTRGTRYFVQPNVLQSTGLDKKTSLSRVEPHRLRALILEDLQRYSPASFAEIHRRIGTEISDRRVRRMLAQLREEGAVTSTGERRWLKYSLPSSIDT